MKTYASLLLLLTIVTTLQADFVRFDKIANQADTTFDVPDGEVWQLVFNHARSDSNNEQLTVTYDSGEFWYDKTTLSLIRGELTIVGPASLSYGGSTSAYGYIIFDVLESPETLLAPQNSVVIPEQPSGTFELS